MENFVSCFAGVDDPRDENARHDLHELLIVAARNRNVADAQSRLVFGAN